MRQFRRLAPMGRAGAVPVLIGADGTRAGLERIHLGSGQHTESWLQELIHANPSVLPIPDIEPGFGDVIAVAREVPCGHGFIDNLYLTPMGQIVLVETKLWQNSQMRREVVAQALDYVAALTGMDFEAFESAVAKGQGSAGKLYSMVAHRPDVLDEPAFVDAVNLNLRRGRMLVIVLGDGIRTETEALSALLQSHAGAHFTFALVEVATWRVEASGEILAVPSTLAKTVMIERGIVRLEQPGMVVLPPSQGNAAKAKSISLEEFWEALAAGDAGRPALVQSLLHALEPYGVYPDLKASLNLKVDLPEREKPLNLGYIQKNGQFWPNPAAWDLPERLWMPYFEGLAALVGGKVINDPGTKFVAVKGRSAPRIEQLLPKHQLAFVAAIERLVREANADSATARR